MTAVGGGDIIRRDHNGVLLFYADPSVMRPHHTSQRPQPSDRERIAVLRAERALIRLELIAQYAGLSSLALDRIDDALEDIYDALQLKRKRFDMYVADGAQIE
jgi:hypothetical protein